MALKKEIDIGIPADVPQNAHADYKENYIAVTRGKNRLVLFSCDQKLEHLNRDFYGPNIDPQDNDPEHMFRIAQEGDIGAFATHLGLIARYGMDYPKINYVVKMNGKTDLVKTEQRDPLSKQLWTIDQVLEFKKSSDLSIVGVGYTLYVGSEYESQMLHEAAQLIYDAHRHGLLTFIWMYPRGKAIIQERSGELIAGAAGVALSLGADFAKINAPLATSNKISEAAWLAIAAQAAGRTKLIVSGGSKISAEDFLQELYDQIHKGHSVGSATGRNIHQRNLDDAVALTRAMSAIVYENKTVQEVMKIIKA
jgi:fructose-bisphosphate aldolase / 6-deoxy-5-ketofructose 1-phosphate synthase